MGKAICILNIGMVSSAAAMHVLFFEGSDHVAWRNVILAEVGGAQTSHVGLLR
ncbi:hypothetical protein AF72_03675 [Xylella taiwanensis]|uniref:Uncharacterized protein n=1 Tax=Xylella taiwanensis TaxID=1444770 RepID=Z9JJT7_9GAMM|nr:hypothetical protein AF72_03675 [Xylella taiwanensis]